jgi:hypothetical protein
MNMQKITFGVILIYLWLMMILLGSIMLETFMIYPNIFHNPPESFEVALQFMSEAAPNTFFPPLGFISWVTGALSVILGWRVKAARYWIVGSVLMILGEGLASMTLFWPRNTIMFVEGLAVHSPEFLRQTAAEFENLHWLRVGFNVAGSVMLFTGMLKYYRHMIITALSSKHVEEASAHTVASAIESHAL